MSIEERRERRLYYTIGEVAEILGENVSAIRHWEKNFKVIRPTRNKKGNRLFSPKDLDNLKTIRYLLKEQGMTIKGANEKMSAYAAVKDNTQKTAETTDLSTQAEIVERLENIRSLLMSIEKNI